MVKKHKSKSTRPRRSAPKPPSETKGRTPRKAGGQRQRNKPEKAKKFEGKKRKPRKREKLDKKKKEKKKK